ncbi:hypothetical protein MKW98_005826 [Papaver atlanticum]|uniref:RING-CH-type domain-containing protein n=1 Tax=Papaver atlanticum TaxID=357466 RepID=A0AAD4TF06_9MAGN|nr:hypothetical protein MKW98_005826 [Papaver atlanticum]
MGDHQTNAAHSEPLSQERDEVVIMTTVEDQSLVQIMECRICQEEDHAVNLENPCACNGTLKYAHRKCVQRWCDEKGNTTCEICQELFEPGYTAPDPSPPRSRADDTTVDISGNWTATDNVDVDDPRLLAMAASRRHFLESDYEDRDRDGASFCRAAAFMLMALLLLRHALAITAAEGDNDAPTLFALFMLRAIGFILPCYITAWAVSMIHYRRQVRGGNSAMSTTEVAIMMQSGENGDLECTLAPNLSGPAPCPPNPTQA